MTAKELDLPSLHERAQQLIELCHYGQVDKSGVDYVSHPMRVAAYVLESISMFERWKGVVIDPVRAATVALLHDTVEDTWVTADILRAMFPEEIVYDVLLLTQAPRETGLSSAQKRERRDAYLHRIWKGGSAAALLVKVADLLDNTDPRRMAELTPKEQRWFKSKYGEDVEFLGLLESPFASRFAHLLEEQA